MSDLLIPNLDPEMTRTLEERARDHDRDASEEARDLLRKSLGLQDSESVRSAGPPPGIGMGTWIFNLVPPEYRVDLDCEIPDAPREPLDFS